MQVFLLVVGNPMSCIFGSRTRWGKDLTQRRVAAQWRIAWVLCITVLLPLVVGACASGPPGGDRAQGWYDRDSIPQFVSETSGPVPPVVDPEYVIGVGDELEVVFLYHSNLTTRDLIVRRDGRISLPYVGDHMAAGITPMVLDSLLESRFSEILREPSLSVIVSVPAPQRVYVLGEVNQPGRVEFGDEITMLQSVASVGGFARGALPGHAILIRRQGVSKIVGVEVDLKAVMDGAALQNDLRLRNYDIVYVPRHPIYSAADFMEQVAKIINMPLDVVYKGWQIANLSSTYEYFQTTQPVQTNGR